MQVLSLRNASKTYTLKEHVPLSFTPPCNVAPSDKRAANGHNPELPHHPSLKAYVLCACFLLYSERLGGA
eukprot:6467499-Amphidinium_carterae.1